MFTIDPLQASTAEDASSMAALEKRLESETFLAGQRATLADVAVCCKIIWCGEGEAPAVGAAMAPGVARWLGTCLNQPQFK